MTDTVNQSGLIIHFLIQHPCEIGIYLVHALPVLDILLQVMEHIGHLDIRASVKRAFQRTDTCGDGRVCICSGGRSHTNRESRVVTTAMFCLQNQ